ncbi:MAG: hypothetical protein EZS28_025106 [Streblomastix strix]|uniref:Protein kinase domain-containing protein n=1 Tax=Streblomastix strix TaxID=222440 RepID=A0A5J4VA82_9EUKA|nr:MAG: hypothetical protein EZS28_025106 [Streblomastix strix]
MASKSYLHAAGTQNYSAPETDENKMTAESDVWSIGVIIIEVITGIHPFQGLTQNQTVSNIANGKYKPFPDYIQGELRMMLEVMISWDYKKRPTVKALLETETMQLVGMIEKSKEQKGSEFENEQMNKKMNEFEVKARTLEIERDRERIEKEIFKQERDQEKRRADTTQSELDKQKTKTNESQELVRAFQQQVEATQSDNTRLRTEIQHLKAELTKLRHLATQPKQQSKPEPKVQQIQRSVPPSLNPNMLIGIIPDKEHAYQEGLKIIHTDKRGDSTVAFNPIIQNGIVRFGGFFEDPSIIPFFSIGIVDSSAVFGSDKYPSQGEIDKKTVCYWSGFENVQYSSAKGVSNGKIFEYEKEWKQ